MQTQEQFNRLVLNTGAKIYYIFEQSKETAIQFSKGTTKVL